MKDQKTIAFCMTSDFAFDQRMQRISSALCMDHKGIILHRKKSSLSIDAPCQTMDIRCFIKSGWFFYLEFNIRIFFNLIKIKSDVIYAVDTDTLLAIGFYSFFYKKKYIFDSHEYFTEVPELNGKVVKKKIWSVIEHLFVPKMDLCLTVGPTLAHLFTQKFAKPFHTIKNVPYTNSKNEVAVRKNIILYQGAINIGRGLHTAVKAMEFLPDFTLLIVGNGDIKNELLTYRSSLPYKERIIIRDAVLPNELKTITENVKFGLNLIEPSCLSYYYSLANKFFDYLQAGVPSINMRFPEYENILKEKPFGIMIDDMDVDTLVQAITTHNEPNVYNALLEQCKKNRSEFTWEIESQKLLHLFHSLN